MNYIVLQDLFYILVLIALAVPIGTYIYKVMMGEKVLISNVVQPVENGIYKVMGIDKEEEMGAKKYVLSIILFTLVGFIFLFALQIIQGYLPFNPENLKSPSWHQAFNTAASFVTNTNWQSYSGENTMSYTTQFLGLTVQNFVSAATGIAVLFALIRGFVYKNKNSLRNFWVDLTKITLYVLIPLSIVVAILIASQGVVQTFAHYKEVISLESGHLSKLPLGPAASQIAIKQLGTNGGGFFGANSAFPLENPTVLSNFIESICLLLLPASLCIAFGKAVKDTKQGWAIFSAMMIIFVVALAVTTFSEEFTGPEFKGVLGLGNMEGKEVIHGVGGSSLWATATTAVSNGSVNSMHDSFTPLGGMVPMFLLQLGEIIFGGVGSGLYGMIAFVILTVFIAGLMVGRTPEFLGKKIEPFNMKMVCLIVLTPPLLTLLGTATTVMVPGVLSWISNSGAHGFSEILYAFSSLANNNGSAFAGFNANTLFTNLFGGIIMLITRFVPMIATIFLASDLAKKKSVAVSDGTLSTNNLMFVGLLIGVIFIIAALSFLPSLALGPVADYFITR